MNTTTAKGSKPTASDLDAADVHEARAALRGDEECRCKLCCRVRRYKAALAKSQRSHWNLKPSPEYVIDPAISAAVTKALRESTGPAWEVSRG